MNRHSKLPDKHKAHDKCSDSGELRTNNTTTHCTSESKEGNQRIKKYQACYMMWGWTRRYIC